MNDLKILQSQIQEGIQEAVESIQKKEDDDDDEEDESSETPEERKGDQWFELALIGREHETARRFALIDHNKNLNIRKKRKGPVPLH